MNKKRLAILGIVMIVCTYVGLAFAAEVRKGGANDLSFATPNQGTATTWLSGGGATVTNIDAAHLPWRNHTGYVDDLVDGGYDVDIKPGNITGDGTDSITGFNIPLYVTAELSLLDAINSVLERSICFEIDGGGGAITTGQKGHLEIPYTATITRATTLADQSGSIVIDIWKDTYANFPPTNDDSITAAAPPTLSGAQKAQDTTLTGWTTSITSGDILAYNVDSATTVTRVTVCLKTTKP